MIKSLLRLSIGTTLLHVRGSIVDPPSSPGKRSLEAPNGRATRGRRSADDASKSPDERKEAEPVSQPRRPFGLRARPTLYLLLLLAITLVNLLSACGSTPPSSNDTNPPYTASKPVNPTICSANASTTNTSNTSTCLEGNAITCVSSSSCYSCDTYTCTPYPQGLTIEQSIELPLWQHNSLFVTTPLNLTTKLSMVQAVWGWSLGTADILAVLLITISGVRVMITGSVFRRAEAATIIPNILLGLIAANLSMVVITVFLSLGNSLSTDLYMWAGSTLKDNMSMVCDAVPNSSSVKTQPFTPDQPSFASLTGLSEFNHPGDTSDTSTSWDHGYPVHWVIQGDTGYKDAAYTAWYNVLNQWVVTANGQMHLGVPGITQQDLANLTTSNGKKAYPEITAACHFGGFGGVGNSNVLTNFQNLAETGNGSFFSSLGNAFRDMWNSFTNFIQVLFQISVLALLGQMVGRFLIIDFFIVTSPLALGSWGLPGRMGQELTGAWFKGISTSVLMQFLQVMALIVGETCLTAIQNNIAASMNISGSNGDQLNTLYYVVGIAFIWFILRIPSMMGSPAVNLVMEMGQQGSRTVGAVIGHSMQEGQMVMNAGMMTAGGLAMAL